MASTPGNPFDPELNGLLRGADFDRRVEVLFAPFHGQSGGPCLPPGTFLTVLRVGDFEDIDPERGTSGRSAGSLSLREVLGDRPQGSAPNHSSRSRIRTRLNEEMHRKAFNLVVAIVAAKGLLEGKALGVDPTTMEVDAARRSILRCDHGRGSEAFLKGITEGAGVQESTRQDLAPVGPKRPKEGSVAEWQGPADPEGRIRKVTGGSTHLALAAEQALAMKSSAIGPATIQDATTGDPTARRTMTRCAMENLCAVLEDPECDAVDGRQGDHANDTLAATASLGARSFLFEPKRAKRRWGGKDEARAATRANRRRIEREKGRAHLRRRSGFLECSFAHTMGSGGVGRAYHGGHSDPSKRYLIHTTAFDLGLGMRSTPREGAPRGVHGPGKAALAWVANLAAAFATRTRWQAESRPRPPASSTPAHLTRAVQRRRRGAAPSTAC
jgi:hypothetical protein